MVWVCIALSIPIVFCLLTYFLKLQLAFEWNSPAGPKSSAGFSFLGYRRTFEFNRASWADDRDEAADDADVDSAGDSVDDSGDGSGSEPEVGSNGGSKGGSSPASEIRGPSSNGQSGFVIVPPGILRGMSDFKKNFRRALVRFALDLPVWRALYGYTSLSGRRVLGLLHPRLEYLHVGMEDVVALGTFAAVWSSLSGIFPSLSGPVEYGFNERPASIRLKIVSRFTGWDILVFVLFTLFSFPWIRLGTRFVYCWRNPHLSRWQRRLLLF